jgi:hypothetical protein
VSPYKAYVTPYLSYACASKSYCKGYSPIVGGTVFAGSCVNYGIVDPQDNEGLNLMAAYAVGNAWECDYFNNNPEDDQPLNFSVSATYAY